MKNVILISTIVFSVGALASGGGHEAASGAGHNEIPFKDIGWQAANLGILLVVLFFVVKQSIKNAFLNRRKNFIDQSEKTKSLLVAAEAALSDVKSKLSVLESGEKASIENAIREAAELKASLIKDAEIQAQKMKDDSKLVANAELEKAKSEIGTIIMGSALASTSKKITDKKAQITKDSEAEFLRQIGQVKA